MWAGGKDSLLCGELFICDISTVYNILSISIASFLCLPSFSRDNVFMYDNVINSYDVICYNTLTQVCAYMVDLDLVLSTEIYNYNDMKTKSYLSLAHF